ncbi:hypothetical protein [Vibrio nereis]|uniref:hypothetical protein n=1 Tax=Vibrio nereis TaxID=693 RepID=UPI00249579DD|nr:hypothetical protein [Vibrio nereis]
MATAKHKLTGVPENAIPPVGTEERKMLELYLSGEAVSEQRLCDEFGRNYRVPLQYLRGDKYRYWHFISLKEKRVIEARYLDERHLSGDNELDALARAERKWQLKRDSKNEAKRGNIRLKRALKEYAEALHELYQLQKKKAQTYRR